MEIKEILKHVDHTLLLQPSTWEEIKQICDDAMKYGTASVCIPPCYVKEAAEYMNGKMAVCTVIGFPNGNTTTATKEFETKDALLTGCRYFDANTVVTENNHIDFMHLTAQGHRELAEALAKQIPCLIP